MAIKQLQLPQRASTSRRLGALPTLPDIGGAVVRGQAQAEHETRSQLANIAATQALGQQMDQRREMKRAQTAAREKELFTTMARVYGQVKTKPKEEQRRVLGMWLDTQRNSKQFGDLIDDDDYNQLDDKWDAITTQFDSMLAQHQARPGGSGRAKKSRAYRHRITGDVVVLGVRDGRLIDNATGLPTDIDLSDYDSFDVADAGRKTEAKERAKVRVETIANLKGDAADAAEQLSQIRLLKQLGRGADLGIEGKIMLGFRKFGDFLGFDVDQSAVSSGEAITQLQTKLSLTLTQMTKGAISDREMDLFLAAVPGLTTSPEGFQLMGEIMEAGARRKIAMSKYAQTLIRQNNNRIPDDLQDQVIEHFQGKPLIPMEKLDKLSGIEVPQGLPAGSRQVGTSGGAPVWEDTDGKRWIIR